MDSRFIYGFLFIGLLLLFTFCDDEKDKLSEEFTSRTILVYMGGKNNLSGETYEKLYAMRDGWDSSINGHLLVYHAPADETPKLLEICTENGANIIKTIEEYPMENSADPDVFNRAVTDMLDEYPASSYGLIVFSHASGWLPPKTLTTPRSVMADLRQEMELLDMVEALPDNRFDFIIFEACFMAGIEVAYELKDKTDYILASSAEILSPGFTSLYKESLHCLFKQKAELKEFAKDCFNYFNTKTGDNCSATFSVINTFSLRNLAAFLNTYMEYRHDIDISEIQHFDRYTGYKLFFDFEDYYLRLIDGEENRFIFSKLVSGCVDYKTATKSFMPYSNGFEVNKHSGMTTYIIQDDFPYLNEEYKKLTWYKDVFD